MMKNIIITGTSRGIGFELVQLFCKAGHQVLALSRNEQPIRELKLEGCTAFSFDITKTSDMTKVSDFIKDTWGKGIFPKLSFSG